MILLFHSLINIMLLLLYHYLHLFFIIVIFHMKRHTVKHLFIGSGSLGDISGIDDTKDRMVMLPLKRWNRIVETHYVALGSHLLQMQASLLWVHSEPNGNGDVHHPLWVV